MSSEDHKSSNSVTKLTSSNYPIWKGEMKAYLQVKGLWLLVDKSAGELYLTCSVDQRMHIDAIQDNPDNFFSIRKQPDKSLSTLIAWIEDGMSKIKELHLTDSKDPYTIKSLDAELICMTMVQSLDEEYSHFTSSLC
ncbi:hypothetical protein K503DRAFT_794934 [Rhizopogon vinicolor AM-OR11-026]|uniref:DUF4219 domain-containing protein n=1 Tax=Rhizopogon vinicolor AM-OR11-026 TaxID=1314800 RepID=A0A1B7MG21_9AGAM|nr:hypothetical protein K503DRAFT_794934 [Rhizopogon vinicolor AM-OR11-026]